ncbi:MAG TPA: hypothetical protein VLS96_21235 [Nodosilinea sp.]|nr:hypothetical protein [Nodosilinea sp.]
MTRNLSSGTASPFVAGITGDAGQLGMAAEFKGFLLNGFGLGGLSPRRVGYRLLAQFSGAAATDNFGWDDFDRDDLSGCDRTPGLQSEPAGDRSRGMSLRGLSATGITATGITLTGLSFRGLASRGLTPSGLSCHLSFWPSVHQR